MNQYKHISNMWALDKFFNIGKKFRLGFLGELLIEPKSIQGGSNERKKVGNQIPELPGTRLTVPGT